MVGWTATGGSMLSLTFPDQRHLMGKSTSAAGRRSTSRAPSSWSRVGWSFTSFPVLDAGLDGAPGRFPLLEWCGGWPGSGSGSGSGSGVTPDPVSPGCPGLQQLLLRPGCLASGRPVGRSVRRRCRRRPGRVGDAKGTDVKREQTIDASNGRGGGDRQGRQMDVCADGSRFGQPRAGFGSWELQRARLFVPREALG